MRWQSVARRGMEEVDKRMMGPAGLRWTALLPALLVVLLPLSAPDAALIGSAGLSYQAASKAKSRAPKVAAVNNLRVSRSGDSSRLVLELAKPATFTQQRMKNP